MNEAIELAQRLVEAGQFAQAVAVVRPNRVRYLDQAAFRLLRQRLGWFRAILRASI